MRLKANVMGICLLTTFVLIFGSIISMVLFSAGTAPTTMSVEALAKQEAH